jgi:hypothetical protein
MKGKSKLPQELADPERNIRSNRPLPQLWRERNPSARHLYYPSDVVWNSYISQEDYDKRYASVVWWLDHRLQLFNPLMPQQLLTLTRLCKFMEKGEVIEAEECISSLIKWEEVREESSVEAN